MNAKLIEKKIKHKIGHDKIQEWLNYYYYAKEFLRWYFKLDLFDFPEKNGNFENRWEFILKFDRYIVDEKLESINVTELIE